MKRAGVRSHAANPQPKIRRLPKRKVPRAEGKMRDLREIFADYNNIMADHRDPKGRGGTWRETTPQYSSDTLRV